MKLVNIYMFSSVKSVRASQGKSVFLLETDSRNGLYTKHEFLELENVTAHQAELATLIKALDMLNQSCELVIHSESSYISSMYERGWISSWKENGWKNSKGNDVANREELEIMDKALEIHDYRFVVGEHTYSSWFMGEIRRKK